MNAYNPTDRTKVRRLPERANFDRETVYSILDSTFVCHVGFVVDGRPVVIPTAFGREGDRLFIHGSAASRMQKKLREGIDVCLTVTLADGLVLARSGFNSSINYRSVVIFGKAVPVEDDAEKVLALKVFSDHVLPGRWEEIREPSPKELKATSVLAIDLEEVSAKVRTGDPHDDEEDYALPVWAGVLPMTVKFGEPIPDPRLQPGTRVPEYIEKARKKA